MGGTISSTSLHRDQIQTGINVIIAGLATQVTSLLMFICLGVEFALRIQIGSHDLAKESRELTETRVWKAFLFGKSMLALRKQVAHDFPILTYQLSGLSLATLCTFTRSCFRIAELSQGFSGPLANNEITFMVIITLPEIMATYAHGLNIRFLRAR